MTNLQNFSYHTHNNALGIFDGKDTPLAMLQKAQELGWTEIGVSNHFIWHPNIPTCHKIFFRDADKFLDTMKRSLDVLREAAAQVKIKVLTGFEVDFFPSALWRRQFEKVRKELDVDYYIGSAHTIFTSDESHIYNIFHLDELPESTTDEDKKELLRNYWQTQIEAIKSGYFTFMAHLDYCTIFQLGVEPEWNDYKWQIIETVAQYKQPYEINTSGFDRIGVPHPHPWMIKELAKRDVPVVLSDDAHSTQALGRHFAEAEQLLASLNYTNRWKLSK